MGAAHQQSCLGARTSGESEDLFLTNCLTARAVGLWAAGLLGLEGDQATAYAESLVVESVKPSHLDLVRKVEDDLRAKGIEISEHRVERMIERERDDARRRVSLRVWSKKPGDGGWERRIHHRLVIPPLVIPPHLKQWLERHMGDGLPGLFR